VLAQADGYRQRMKLVQGDELESFAIEKQYETAFRKWFMGTGNTLFKFLQEQLNPPWNSAPENQDVLPVLSNGLPPDDCKPRHLIGLDNSEEWLSKALDELRELSAMFAPPAPARPGTSKASAPAPAAREAWLSKGVIATVVIGVVGIAVTVVLAFWH
jgi:hypothetical protein